MKGDRDFRQRLTVRLELTPPRQLQIPGTPPRTPSANQRRRARAAARKQAPSPAHIRKAFDAYRRT